MAGLIAGLMLGGCRDGVTLDTQGTTSGGEGSNSSGDSTDTSGGEPVVCEPSCALGLRPDWSYVGLGGIEAIAGLHRTDDGRLIAGAQRAVGGFIVVELSPDGEERASLAPQLLEGGTDLVDMALHPSGDVLLTTKLNGSAPVTVLTRFSPELGAVLWSRTFVLTTFMPSTMQGAARVAVVDDDRIAHVRVQTFVDGDSALLVEMDGDGNSLARRNLASAIVIGGTWPMFVEAGPFGDVHVTLPRWTFEDPPQLQAAALRLVPPHYDIVSDVEVPVLLDDFAIDSAGNRIELAQSEGDQTVTLLVAHRAAADPLRWDAAVPMVSSASSRARLAVGPNDDVYAAVRTTPRLADDAFFEVEFSMARWSADGEFLGQASVPLDMAATSRPFEFVVDDRDGVVVATIVAGQIVVARYEQTCDCG